MDAAVRCFDPGPPQKHLCFPQRSGALVEAVVRWGTQWCVGKRSTAFENAALRSGTQQCVLESPIALSFCPHPFPLLPLHLNLTTITKTALLCAIVL